MINIYDDNSYVNPPLPTGSITGDVKLNISSNPGLLYQIEIDTETKRHFVEGFVNDISKLLSVKKELKVKVSPKRNMYDTDFTVEFSVSKDGEKFRYSKDKEYFKRDEVLIGFPIVRDGLSVRLVEASAFMTDKEKQTEYLKSQWKPQSLNKSEDKTKEQVSLLVKELLSGHVDYLSKIVYNTQILLSQKVKETVLSRYKKLTKQTKSYFRFMGPQPITLNKDNLKIAHPDSIVKQYCVTEKADGERYYLSLIKRDI